MLKRAVHTVLYGAAYTRLLLAHQFSKRVPAESRANGAMRRAALLIPGFLGTRSVMHPLERRLERIGIPTFSVNVGFYSTISFDVVKQLVQERVQNIRERYPYLTRLDVVGHSMGGLIALELYLEGVFRGLQVRLVTLGTPFRGTWAALLGLPFSRSARDMVPFFRRRPAAFEVAVPFLSIAGEADLLAPPVRCQHPDADYKVFDTDHAGLLFRKEVFHEICRFCA